MNLDKTIEQLAYIEEQLEQLEDLLFKGIRGSSAYKKASYMYSKLIEERNKVWDKSQSVQLRN